MFSSRTLTDRGHRMIGGSHERNYGPECRCGREWDYFADTCFGTLPENPILVAFREACEATDNDGAAYIPALASEWLADTPRTFYWLRSDLSLRDYLAYAVHAYEVLSKLSLLAAVTR